MGRGSRHTLADDANKFRPAVERTAPCQGALHGAPRRGAHVHHGGVCGRDPDGRGAYSRPGHRRADGGGGADLPAEDGQGYQPDGGDDARPDDQPGHRARLSPARPRGPGAARRAIVRQPARSSPHYAFVLQRAGPGEFLSLPQSGGVRRPDRPGHHAQGAGAPGAGAWPGTGRAGDLDAAPGDALAQRRQGARLPRDRRGNRAPDGRVAGRPGGGHAGAAGQADGVAGTVAARSGPDEARGQLGSLCDPCRAGADSRSAAGGARRTDAAKAACRADREDQGKRALAAPGPDSPARCRSAPHRRPGGDSRHHRAGVCLSMVDRDRHRDRPAGRHRSARRVLPGA
jgi:hypothetical protein